MGFSSEEALHVICFERVDKSWLHNFLRNVHLTYSPITDQQHQATSSLPNRSNNRGMNNVKPGRNQSTHQRVLFQILLMPADPHTSCVAVLPNKCDQDSETGCNRRTIFATCSTKTYIYMRAKLKEFSGNFRLIQKLFTEKKSRADMHEPPELALGPEL